MEKITNETHYAWIEKASAMIDWWEDKNDN
jgi:hypothetical protein